MSKKNINIRDLLDKRNRKRKFKFKKGSSKSKDRNFWLNAKHKKFRPDAIMFNREKRVSINRLIWKFNSYDNFDEES